MKTLYLLDANSLIHRAFHALPPLTAKGGQSTGALYGLSSILLKILREEKPDYIAAFFDRPEPTFRKQIFEHYKIQRPKAPDELVSQIIEARNLFREFGIKIFEAPGYEADDLIGTAAGKFQKEKDIKIIILTGDLDTLQLIKNEKVLVKALIKGVSETALYDEDAVKNRYGLSPEKLPDYKSLIGDSSDNIPGVKGIGPKTAATLIQKYGSLENFMEKGGSEKYYEKVKNQQEQVFLARKLAVIKRDAPLKIENIAELKFAGLPIENLNKYFEKLGFQTLIKRINNTPSLF